MKNKKLFAILTLVCFMFTLMPVAAFAAGTDFDNTQSALYLADREKAVKPEVAGGTSFNYNIKIENVNGAAADIAANMTNGLEGERLYIWAEENGVISPALNAPVVANGNWPTTVTVDGETHNSNPHTGAKAAISNVYELAYVKDGATITLTFARPGVYTVKAGFGAAGADALNEIRVFTAEAVTATVLGSAVNPANYYMEVTGAAAANGFDAYIGNVVPNNVTNQWTVNFYEDNTKAEELVGKTVTFKADSANITVSPATATTDALGRVKINLSAAREGVYTIYATVDGKTFTIGVSCGNTQAAKIETSDEPDNKVALYEQAEGLIAFTITDINDNAVKDLGLVTRNTEDPTKLEGAAGKGANGLCVNDGGREQYLHFIEKPAASTITNNDLSLAFAIDAQGNRVQHEDGEYYVSFGNKTLDAEGKYTVRAILDNGAVATASFEVKAFETPVELVIDAPATVELGTSFTPDLYYLDANGVEKDADTDAKLAATGYAIYSFAGNTVTVKTDEKYAGQTITLTAVSEMYDLVDVEEVKVAAEAVAIEFADDALEVNVNNKVKWNVVDSEGNKVTLDDKSVRGFEVKYVVLDKPADAKVSVYDLTDKPFDGEGKMALTSNKVGNVTVQVVAQVEVASTGAENVLGATQTKYYTGTEIFAVGTADKGDVVVMSIGSNEIVINDAKGTIDAAPIVENNRTFVPFRALAEAFGATVAYDEATQAVTAELNGVTVVMTIGSAEYTVNGVAKTADVAPFINGSRTMVPVIFAAEAFGIKVIPTYDENGATADILFNL